MRSIAIVDASPLYAATDSNERTHRRCLDVLRRRDLDLVIPALVVTEATQLIAKRLGPSTEARFLRGLANFEIEPPAVDEWEQIADLVDRYANFPLGTVDASIVILADRLQTDLIVTLDRRHFAAVQSPKGRRFRLLPESTSVHEEPATYARQS